MHELMFQAGLKGMSERSELIPCTRLQDSCIAPCRTAAIDITLVCVIYSAGDGRTIQKYMECECSTRLCGARSGSSQIIVYTVSINSEN